MKEENNDKVPLFKTWRQWYVFIVAILVLQIVLFYLITQHFA